MGFEGLTEPRRHQHRLANLEKAHHEQGDQPERQGEKHDHVLQAERVVVEDEHALALFCRLPLGGGLLVLGTSDAGRDQGRPHGRREHRDHEQHATDDFRPRSCPPQTCTGPAPLNETQSHRDSPCRKQETCSTWYAKGDSSTKPTHPYGGQEPAAAACFFVQGLVGYDSCSTLRVSRARSVCFTLSHKSARLARASAWLSGLPL